MTCATAFPISDRWRLKSQPPVEILSQMRSYAFPLSPVILVQMAHSVGQAASNSGERHQQEEHRLKGALSGAQAILEGLGLAMFSLTLGKFWVLFKNVLRGGGCLQHFPIKYKNAAL